jgi:hypothetical protein
LKQILAHNRALEDVHPMAESEGQAFPMILAVLVWTVKYGAVEEEGLVAHHVDHVYLASSHYGYSAGAALLTWHVQTLA